MVNKQLRINTKHLVKHRLALKGTSGYVTHGVHPYLAQAVDYAPPHSPEISERRMSPKLAAVTHLIKLRYSHPVSIGGNMLGHNVHSHLA